MSKVAMLSRIISGDSRARARLEDAGIEIVLDFEGYEMLDGRVDRWHDAMHDVDALVVGVQAVDQTLFQAAPRLRYVLRVGTGLDNIDTEAAAARGVRVEALAGMNAGAVAEYAFGLLIAAARRIVEADATVRAGNWLRLPGRQLQGRTLGLVGYGAIARSMVAKAIGFEMNIMVARHAARRPIDSIPTVPLDQLLSAADFVSLHVPLTSETRNLIGRREVALMNGTVLVNTSRGAVVDEGALYEGLLAGHVAACALDVFANEPPTGSPLLGLPNVVVSPHNAAHSDLTNERIAESAVDFLLRALASPPGYTSNPVVTTKE